MSDDPAAAEASPVPTGGSDQHGRFGPTRAVRTKIAGVSEPAENLELPLKLDPTLAGPGSRVRRLLGVVAVLCLAGAVVVSGTILLAWWLPPLADALPSDWHRMVGATSAVLLLYSIGLLVRLVWPESNVGLAVTGIGLLVTLVGLLGLAFTDDGGPTLLLCGPSHTAAPSSVQTLTWEFLFGLGLVASQTRFRWSGHLTTALVSAVGLLTLILVSAHVFSAQEIVTGPRALNSPQTALTMTLLLFAWYAVMQRNGHWPLGTSATATGRLVRLYLPVIVCGPLVMAQLAVSVGGALGWEEPLTLAVSLAGTVALLVGGLLIAIPRVWTLEQAYRLLAYTDPLTGLANRRGLEEEARLLLSMARREGRPIAVAVVDLVGLKAINDTQGHDLGSEAIVAMARSLRGGLRPSDLVARVGGDEFLVLALGDKEALRSALERIAVGSTTSSGLTVPNYSLGLSEGHPDDFEQLWVEADQRMYESRAG